MFAFMWWMLIGLVAGAIARLLVPGRQPMGCLLTMALGLVGSLVGGALGSMIWGVAPGERAIHASGLFGSIIGAIVVLLVFGMVQRRNPPM